MSSQMPLFARQEGRPISGIFLFAQRIALPFLRISLGLVFLWIGLTKFLDPKPVVGVLAASFSFLAFDAFVYILGGLEIAAALLLFIGVGLRYVGIPLLLFFAGTLIIFLVAPAVMYSSRGFPALSLAGQFFLKDIALAAAVVIIMVQDATRQAAKQAE